MKRRDFIKAASGLLVPAVAQAQILPGILFGSPAAAGGVDAAATAIINACTTPPSAAAQTAINNFVVALKAISITGGLNGWDETDEIFCSLYTGTTADSLLNWKAPTGAKWVNNTAVTFARIGGSGSMGGYTGTAGHWLESVTALNAGGLKFLQDDAHISIRIEGATGSENFAAMGLNGQAEVGMHPFRVSGNTFAAINGAGGITKANPGDAPGFYFGRRTTSTGTEIFKDGSSLGTSNTDTSSAVVALKLLLGAGNGDFTTKQFTFASFGSGAVWSAPNIASFATAVASLTTALKAG